MVQTCKINEVKSVIFEQLQEVGMNMWEDYTSLMFVYQS